MIQLARGPTAVPVQKLEVARRRPPLPHGLGSRVDPAHADAGDDLEGPLEARDAVDDVEA